MYVWVGGGGSVPWSLRPLLTQLRLQRNVLSEAEGEERVHCSVIDRPSCRKVRCICRLSTRRDVFQNFVSVILSFNFFFIFTPVGQVKTAKIFPHDLIRIPSVAVENRGATVTLESTCHKR